MFEKRTVRDLHLSVCLLCNLHISLVKVYLNLRPILGGGGICVLTDVICYFHLGLDFRNPDGSPRSLPSNRHFKLPFPRRLVSSHLLGIYRVSVTRETHIR